MTPIGLFLAVGLTIGVAAQSCDVGDTGFTIDDLRDRITVTNASTDEDAYAYVSTSLGERNFHLAPGSSETVLTLAARKYTLEVYGPEDPSGATYKQSLVDLRDELVGLSINPADSAATPESAMEALLVVEKALHQLRGSQTFQSCSGAIKHGVDNHASATWTSPGGISGVWVLSCG